MAMHRKLSDREVALLRKASGDGYLTYRYGSARPVTLPRLFSGQKRRHMVDKVLDTLRDWRMSPFEHEGPARSGVRMALVLDGNGWQQSDNEAEALIGEALHRMGAKRPSDAEAAPEYTIARENCANCLGPLDDEAIANHDRFCCTECRTSMRTYRNSRYWIEATKTARWAYEVARKEGIAERPCAWCGAMFKPSRHGSSTCSPEHAAKLREQRAGRSIPEKPCANPACGKLFHPAKSSVEYCSQKCHREHQGELIGPKLCDNPTCGKVFHPRFAFERYCEAKCRKEVESRRTLPEKPCANPDCGKLFAPKKPSNEYCGRSCASRARVAKASRFACEEVREAA